MLEHSLLVANDHFRCIQIEQLLQAVVAVDQTTVKVVEITGRKVSALQKNERTKVGRNHRNRFENHPLRLVAGFDHRTDNSESANQTGLLLLGTGGLVLFLQLIEKSWEIEIANHGANRFRPHVGLELISVLLAGEAVLFLIQKLLLLERRISRIQDHVVLVVDHPLEVGGLQFQQIAQTGWHGLEEPNVNHRCGEIDVSHALATDAGMGHLDATAVTDDVLVLDALVLSAGTFPVLFRSENSLAEESILFRTVGPVVDGLGLFHLSVGPREDIRG